MKVLGLIFFIFFQGFGFTQITNNGKVISNKNATKIPLILVLTKNKKSIIIPQNKKVEIYFKDSSKNCKGVMSIINDSTILVNGSTIYLSQILKIKTKLKTRDKGIVLLSLAGLSAGLSIYSFYNFTNSSTLGDLFAFGFLTIASGGIAIGLLPSSIILISNGVDKYYKSDNWTFSIEPLY